MNKQERIQQIIDEKIYIKENLSKDIDIYNKSKVFSKYEIQNKCEIITGYIDNNNEYTFMVKKDPKDILFPDKPCQTHFEKEIILYPENKGFWSKIKNFFKKPDKYLFEADIE